MRALSLALLSFEDLVSHKDLAGFVSTGNVLLPASVDRVDLPISENLVSLRFNPHEFRLQRTFIPRQFPSLEAVSC
jgi:hypothetical protein